MKYIITDTEVFAHDWIIDFRAYGQDKHYTIHNDYDKALYFFNTHPDDVFVTFNGKHYDNYIIKAILNRASAETVKDINDFIINGNEGYKHPFTQYCRYKFNYCDLMDDMQVGLSLKSIEAHLGMDIEETEVDFNLQRPLTQEELDLTIKYCRYDVDATYKVFELRQAYLDNKIMVGKMAGLSEQESLQLTNAKLTAEYLKASPVSYKDERDYQYPENLLKQYIESPVFDFFDRLHDKSLSDDEVFKTQYKGKIGDCSFTLGFGGIHGDCGNCIVEETDNVVIVNEDVGSYYPHLVVINGYVSRAISDATEYAEMLEQRMKAKASGDKQTANALKLVCNSTYGAFGDRYNKLYDPKMMRAVCISGQLYLLELATHLYTKTHCDFIQLNTDGLMFAIEKSKLPLAEEICNEWQQRTGFSLERDDIVRIVQKDVNNYLEIKNDNSFKCKGGYLVRGISSAGAFNINNNAVIIADAIKEYFLNGKSPEETIMKCDDILKFQLIAKASGKYKAVYHNNKEVQRCNRVYASPFVTDGTLYKLHNNGQIAKIAGLPEHCIVDNSNELSINDIDRRWYIQNAYSKIQDYIGR